MAHKLSVKFFLHPLATEDMLEAAQEGTTKIDRYRHQYFVSLEIYALDAQEGQCLDDKPTECLDDKPTQSRITRSTIALLSTGSPPTRTKTSKNRDWLLSVVNNDTKRARSDPDPLDRFRSDQTAARKVLGAVCDDLRMNKRQRDYQADFLLYSIIDRAASEIMPIYNAYGRRLRKLQHCLDNRKLSTPKHYTFEMQKVRHELQELKQWVGQIKGIVNHLETDCTSCSEASGIAEANLWHFGADLQGQGQSMRVFLRHTDFFLDQASDRVKVLDELAQSFMADLERYRQEYQSQALFVFAFFTAVFLPAQFLAGVYGMNFSGSDGEPGIPELRWQHGYLYFWITAGAMLVGLPVTICTWFHCSGNCLTVCRRRCRHQQPSSSVDDDHYD